jgi:hypothetical protein
MLVPAPGRQCRVKWPLKFNAGQGPPKHNGGTVTELAYRDELMTRRALLIAGAAVPDVLHLQVLAAGAVIHQDSPAELGKHVPYRQADLVQHSPVTPAHGPATPSWPPPPGPSCPHCERAIREPVSGGWADA